MKECFGGIHVLALCSLGLNAPLCNSSRCSRFSYELLCLLEEETVKVFTSVNVAFIIFICGTFFYFHLHHKNN